MERTAQHRFEKYLFISAVQNSFPSLCLLEKGKEAIREQKKNNHEDDCDLGVCDPGFGYVPFRLVDAESDFCVTTE
jgi:hypothetical protein